jgi:hypothetical protein
MVAAARDTWRRASRPDIKMPMGTARAMGLKWRKGAEAYAPAPPRDAASPLPATPGC